MSKIVFDEKTVKDWYARNDVYQFLIISTRCKYISFMAYKMEGTTSPPRRFMTLSAKPESYKWILKYNNVGIKPTSIYRDVDNWKYNRIFFDNKPEVYKAQREDFFKNRKYRNYLMNPDFVMDVDGENIYESWDTAFKIVELYRQFNVMFSIWCSGKKGWQILVAGYKAIKKEYFQVGEREHNTHKIIAFNIKKYINDEKDHIDLSSFDDLRFVKQPYSLDGRNMCPIIPLSYEEFIKFKEYENEEVNPYTSIHRWEEEDFLQRGFNWQGREDMSKLDAYLDDWIDKHPELFDDIKKDTEIIEEREECSKSEAFD